MNSKTINHVLVLFLLLLPVVTLAQFRPLVGIPGISDPTMNLNSYINVLYALSISIAALLAVIKIIIAGVKYMLSDLISSKQEAKSDIQGALIGLLIVISAVLILNVINPQLTQSTLFLSPVDRVPANNSALGSGGGGTPTAPAPVAPVAATNSSCVYRGASATPPYDCTAANTACTTSGGTPGPAGRNGFGMTRTGEITCTFGTNINIPCEQTPDSNAPSGYTYQCITATNQCQRSGGTPTITGAGETVSCYTTNR